MPCLKLSAYEGDSVATTPTISVLRPNAFRTAATPQIDDPNHPSMLPGNLPDFSKLLADQLRIHQSRIDDLLLGSPLAHFWSGDTAAQAKVDKELKPLLPPGAGLSTPSVVKGGDYSLRICGDTLCERLHFADSAGEFRVTLIIG